MTDKPENPAAFARPGSDEGYHPPQEGMSLRDYFAAAALPALIEKVGHPIDGIVEDIVGAAYQIADSMLEERRI